MTSRWQDSADDDAVADYESRAEQRLAEARGHEGQPTPEVTYLEADLAAYRGPVVDLVLAAGNVIPLLAPGTLRATLQALAARVRPGGLLLCGGRIVHRRLRG